MALRIAWVVLAVAAAGNPAAAERDWVDAWTDAMTRAADVSSPAAREPALREALELAARHGNGSLRHARTLDELAFLQLESGALEPAEAMYLESVPMLQRLLGPDQPRVATSMHNLGVLYLRSGRENEAEPWIREALRIWLQSFGPEHPDTARAYRSLGVLMRRRGEDAEADRLERLAAPLLSEPQAGPAR